MRRQLLSSAGHGAIEVCSDVSAAVCDGLDLTDEARVTVREGLGDVVLVDDGFAVCQRGAGTEAGGGALYVKLAAVKPGRAGSGPA